MPKQLLPLPTKREYRMSMFVRTLIASGRRESSVLVYASLIRTALKSLESAKLVDIIEYCGTGSMNRSFPAAWNLFAPYMRAKGYDVDSIPTSRGTSRLLGGGSRPDPHPQLDNILIILRFAFKRHYTLVEPLRVGDFFPGDLGAGLSDVDSPGVGNTLNETQTNALMSILQWAWGLSEIPPHGRDNSTDDRPLLIVTPGSHTPLSGRQLRAFADFDGDLSLVRRLRQVAKVQEARGFDETPLSDLEKPADDVDLGATLL